MYGQGACGNAETVAERGRARREQGEMQQAASSPRFLDHNQPRSGAQALRFSGSLALTTSGDIGALTSGGRTTETPRPSDPEAAQPVDGLDEQSQ
jgi:hypothetical protein